MAITFDSVELTNPEVFEQKHNVLTKATTLLSGKTSVQSTSETHLTVSFRCLTETYSDITDLKAKIGSKYVLSIDGTTYNCYISKFSEKELAPGIYEYTVSFIEDTTS